MRDGPNLVKALERAIHQPDDDWGKDRLHVSDLAVAIEGADGKCPRQLWLRLSGAERTPTHPGQQLMFDAGHRLHRATFAWLEKGLPEGWVVWLVERDLSRLLPDGLTGRCDLTLMGPNGEHVVVDVKTLRGAGFRWMTDAAKPANALQVQAYMMALDADYGIILYIDREGQNFAKQFYVERDDERVHEAFGVATAVAALPVPMPVLEPVTKKGKLAEPWQCDWCDYRGVSCPGALANYEERTLNAQLVASIEALP